MIRNLAMLTILFLAAGGVQARGGSAGHSSAHAESHVSESEAVSHEEEAPEVRSVVEAANSESPLSLSPRGLTWWYFWRRTETQRPVCNVDNPKPDCDLNE
jgi:hypothetical protein